MARYDTGLRSACAYICELLCYSDTSVSLHMGTLERKITDWWKATSLNMIVTIDS